MSVNVTLGLWVLPLAWSVVLLTWALVPRASERRSGDYDFGFMLPAVFRALGAVIGSLVAWLIWALVE